MADLPPHPDPHDDTGVDSSSESTTGTPQWVKMFGIVALILVLLIIIMMLVSGGEHGPGRHRPSGGLHSRTPLVHLTVQGMQPS